MMAREREVVDYGSGDPGAVMCRWCGNGRFLHKGALLCRTCDGTPATPVLTEGDQA